MEIYSFSPFGYEGSLVQVEVDLRRGIPAVDIVGLADSAVKEARERMQSAIRNSGFEFPSERVLIALSPADLRKEGAGLDLPMALSVLTANEESDKTWLVIGELELSGRVRSVRGVHAAVSTALSCGITNVIVPTYNAKEANLEGVTVYAVENLKQAYAAIMGEEENFKEDLEDEDTETVLINGVQFPKLADCDHSFETNAKALRALTIAVAGNHNFLFVGAPGCGKTILAQNASKLFPSLTYEEAQSVTRIWSLAGLLELDKGLMRERPLRIPHQTASIEGICGGGINCRPGEISLAHNGMLLLDEAAEFRSSVLQMLRVPLEHKSITLSRAGRSTIYPAKFQLGLATNPCPCGNYGVPDRVCLCSKRAVEQYWNKFSAPLLERIGLRVMFDESDFKMKFDVVELRKRIAVAVKKQRERGFYNGDATPDQISILTDNFDKSAKDAIDKIELKYELSPRRLAELVKVSQTCADIKDVKVTAEVVNFAFELMDISGVLPVNK